LNNRSAKKILRLALTIFDMNDEDRLSEAVIEEVLQWKIKSSLMYTSYNCMGTFY